MKELALLVHAELMVVVEAERNREILLVPTAVRSPVRSPVRSFAGTIAGTSWNAVVDSVATAIFADTTYRRLRSREPK